MKNIAILLVVFASVCALAQAGEMSSSPVGVAVKATVQFGEFKPVTGSNPFKGLPLKQSIMPAGEVVLFPSKRVSFGIEALTGLKTGTQSIHMASVVDQYFYVVNGKAIVVSEPGKEFAASDQDISGKIRVAVLGNMYVNGGKAGDRVRPFIVGGYGIGFAEKLHTAKFTIDPVFQQRTGFQYVSGLDRFTIRSQVQILKIGGGANVRLAPHVYVRVEGGYRNGGYAALGVQFQ